MGKYSDAVRTWAKANGHERDLNINAKTLEPYDKVHYRK